MNEVDPVAHANIGRDDLLGGNKKCWDAFYSIKEVLRRVRRGRPSGWPWVGKFVYLLLCLAFKRIYGGQGMAADGVRRRRLGTITKTIIKVGIAIYNHYFPKRLGVKVGHPWTRAAAAQIAEGLAKRPDCGNEELQVHQPERGLS
jgi:hypothetical protein